MAWRAPGFDPIDEVGTGATGTVIVSRDAITGTEVAIKYLSKEVYRAPGFATEFPHEVETLSGVEHPHLVQIYEYVEGPGTGALVMELVRGPSVRALLANGPLEPEAAFYVIKCSLMGLAMIHRSRIMHRDFRPDNLLVAEDATVKVGDIGLAVRDRRSSPKPGDARYLAPERWAGLPATPATDVYAVASTLYELLTGHTPHTRDKKPLGRSGLSTDSDIAALIPTDLADHVRRLLLHELAQQPTRRSSHANAMLDELELVALDVYGPLWEDLGRAQMLRRLARVTTKFAPAVKPAEAAPPEPAPAALEPLPTRGDAIEAPVAAEAAAAFVSEPLPKRVPTRAVEPAAESLASAPDQPPVQAPVSPAGAVPVGAAPEAAARTANTAPGKPANAGPADAGSANTGRASAPAATGGATNSAAAYGSKGNKPPAIVRPGAVPNQTSATDIYAPVGSAALVVEAEMAKAAAAAGTDGRSPDDESFLVSRLGRRGRILTAVGVTLALGLGVLTFSSGWLSASEASPNPSPNVPDFTHSAIVVPGPSIPAPAPSSPTRDNVKPTQPTALHVISRSQTAVSLDWNASADNVKVVGYIVQRAGKIVGTTYDPGFTDTGLSANSSYHYTVVAFDKAGNKSASSPSVSATTLVAPDTAPPSVPTGLHSTSVSVSTIGLSWSMAHDNIGVAGYDVFRDGHQVASVTKTSYVDKGLSAKSTHTYYVRAFDASNNESGSSRAISASTLAQKDTTPPSTPTNVHVVATSETSITIAWTASTDNSGTPTYLVSRGPVTFPVTGPSFPDSQLQPDTSYTYSVVAVDATGNKSTPASVTGHTDAPAPSSPPPSTTPPTDTPTPTPTPTPGQVTDVSVSGSNANAPDCQVSFTITVTVDGPIDSVTVHYDVDGVGSGNATDGPYAGAGSYDIGIGPFTVTTGGGVLVSSGANQGTGSFTADAACVPPTEQPTDPGTSDTSS